MLLLGFYISLSFNKTYQVNSKDNNEQNNEKKLLLITYVNMKSEYIILIINYKMNKSKPCI